MANTLQILQMDAIYANPLNQRSMDEEEINIMKESILEVGLLHPLTVYKEGENRYVLISGHKRFEALKRIGRKGNATVQCTIVDKPSDASKEAEMMARANVHRSSPEQIKKEVELVNNLWNTMDSKRRSFLVEKYKKAFIKEHETDPKYIENPQTYITNRFRPRLDYINHITGLNASNRTLSGYLANTLKREREDIEEPKVKKEKVITIRNVLRSIDSLQGLIEGYAPNCSDAGMQSELESLKNALEASGRKLRGEY